jgi:hypothetical protein
MIQDGRDGARETLDWLWNKVGGEHSDSMEK